MEKKNYVSIFIVCCIFIEGMGHLTEENNTEESSKFRARRKRLIYKGPDESKLVSIEQVPYAVSIQKNGQHICGGSILEPHIILTAAHCVEKRGIYKILSGSAYLMNGTYHKVIKIIRHPKYRPETYSDDIALLVIVPIIDFKYSPNDRIPLFTGDIPSNTLGTISGWGCIKESFILTNYFLLGHPPTGPINTLGTNSRWSWFRRIPPVFPLELRSINVPIISLDQCLRVYEGESEITNDVICTFDTIEHKRCGPADSGNGLVVDGQLIGVMSWHGSNWCCRYCPDVFMNLSQPKYRIWILTNIPHIPKYSLI